MVSAVQVSLGCFMAFSVWSPLVYMIFGDSANDSRLRANHASKAEESISSRLRPEDQAFAAFGVRAGDGEHAVNLSAGFQAQADQVIESFGQIHRDFTAHAVAHDGEGVGERIGEVLAQQAGTAGCFYAKRVAQLVVLGQLVVFRQQIAWQAASV